MFVDVIIFAVIFAILAYRLWSVLGQGGPDDPTTPSSKPSGSWSPHNVAVEPVSDRQVKTSIDSPEVSSNSQAREILDPELVKRVPALKKIANSDRIFSLSTFLKGAEKAFEMVTGAFCQGDKATLKRLLSTSLYKGFTSDIDSRKEKGESLERTIVSLQKPEVVAASLEGRKASITLRYISKQIFLTRNHAKTLEGSDDQTVSKPVSLNDLWTFSRNLGSSDPNWLLVETAPGSA